MEPPYSDVDDDDQTKTRDSCVRRLHHVAARRADHAGVARRAHGHHSVGRGRLMLSLSDEQMDVVMRGAMLMPAVDRDVYLRSIGSRLDGERCSNLNVEEAVLFVLSCRGIAAAPLALHDDISNPQPVKETTNGHKIFPFRPRRRRQSIR
jgi:hypothetical protein